MTFVFLGHGPQNHSSKFPCNFLNIAPFLTRPLPIESSRSKLSIGTGLVKNGSILRKLWSNLVESFQQGTENDPHKLSGIYRRVQFCLQTSALLMSP